MSGVLNGILSVLIMVLILAVLITVHEFGHYIAARLCGIKVREFAIGMGPVIWKKKPKGQEAVVLSGDLTPVETGTVFSIRAIPFGGFCDMGEDEESDDPNHFRNKKLWQKVLVLVAGSFMNLLTGVILIVIIAIASVGLFKANSVVMAVSEDFPYTEIQPGDRIVKINGHAIYDYGDVQIFLGRDQDKPYTFMLERDGSRFEVGGIERTLEDEEGNKVFGLTFGGADELTAAGIPRYVLNTSVNYVRQVWIAVGGLISGQYGLNELAGPVGIGSVVNDTISNETVDVGIRVINIVNLAALIAVNLAVMNMLPIPALDGGRVLFLFISAFLMLVRKRPLSEKVEGYIHGITFILLIGLMVVVFFSDFRKLLGFG